MSYEVTAEILNFGAFLGFMGVNLAVIWQFWVRGDKGQRAEFLCGCDSARRRFSFLHRDLVWTGGARQDRRRHLVRRRRACAGGTYSRFPAAIPIT